VANNGSPEPIFETNEQNTHVLATLPVHELAAKDDQVNGQDSAFVFSSIEDVVAFCDQANDQVSDQSADQVRDVLNDSLHNRDKDILEVATTWIRRSDLFEEIYLSNHSTNREKYLII
jgi:ATP-dependent DNA helicase RecG